MATREQVDDVLGRFRPLLLADGLSLEVLNVVGGRVTLRLTAAHLCAATPLSFQTGLEGLLRDEVPDFDELILLVDTGV